MKRRGRKGHPAEWSGEPETQVNTADEEPQQGHRIDAILDAWEHAHENGEDVFNLFYDIQQAYDSVRHDDLVAALRRLRMPAAFVDLVRDSLTGLTSCVRTAYVALLSFRFTAPFGRVTLSPLSSSSAGWIICTAVSSATLSIRG
jgi:hypothetical protein